MKGLSQTGPDGGSLRLVLTYTFFSDALIVFILTFETNIAGLDLSELSNAQKTRCGVVCSVIVVLAHEHKELLPRDELQIF